MVLRPFGLKTGKDFSYFDLESGMVFEGTTGCMNVFPVSIPNKERVIFELEMNFLEIFCCRSNLSNNDIISQTAGLKTGMDFRGQVWKRAWEK